MQCTYLFWPLSDLSTLTCVQQVTIKHIITFHYQSVCKFYMKTKFVQICINYLTLKPGDTFNTCLRSCKTQTTIQHIHCKYSSVHCYFSVICYLTIQYYLMHIVVNEKKATRKKYLFVAMLSSRSALIALFLPLQSR